MKIRASYEHGSLLLQGHEIYFRNYTAEVPDNLGKIILQKGDYMVFLNTYRPLNQAQNILLIRESGLGDALMVTPIARLIKQEVNPGANIHVMAGEFCCLWQGNPYIVGAYNSDTLPGDATNRFDYLAKFNSVEFENDSNFVHRIDVFGARIPGLPLPIKNKHMDYYVTQKKRNGLEA